VEDFPFPGTGSLTGIPKLAVLLAAFCNSRNPRGFWLEATWFGEMSRPMPRAPSPCREGSREGCFPKSLGSKVPCGFAICGTLMGQAVYHMKSGWEEAAAALPALLRSPRSNRPHQRDLSSRQLMALLGCPMQIRQLLKTSCFQRHEHLQAALRKSGQK